MSDISEGVEGGESSHPMDFLLSQDLNLPVAGEIRTGVVVEHRNGEIIVDIGTKSEGIIRAREVEGLDASAQEELAIGNEVTVCIVEPEDERGNLVLSYTQAAAEQDWQHVTKLMESEDICKGKVVGFNRGGLLVKVGELRGFVPNSQLGRSSGTGRVASSEERFQKMVGRTLEAKVIEVDRARNRLILSARAAERELRQAKREELLEELNEGDILDGRVVSLADFGAFVDIGGMEGLVHLSELSWKRVNHPSEVVKQGDEVRVQILGIDREKQRLALSLKRLQADPWSTLEEKYQVGQLVEATITKLTKFGAFARIIDEYELVGLIHISELSDDHVAHPRDVVNPSDNVMVRIIRVDSEQRQLGLSLKQVGSDKYMETDLEMMAAE